MAEDDRRREEITDKLEKANEYTDAAEDLYSQFNFKKSLKYFEKGIELLIEIKKKTKDDKKFNKKIKNRIEEAFTRAETCKKQIKMEKKGKTKAGITCLDEDTRLKDEFQQILSSSAKLSLEEQQEKDAMCSVNSIYDSKGFSKPNLPGTASRTTEDDIEESKSGNKKKLKINSDLLEQLEENIVPKGKTGVCWDDIKGLSDVKKVLNETIIYPQKRPDLFQGIRAPVKGILFYGPPGNGKTMLAKAVASECDCTFISVSASSLMSKFMGEGEKLMRGLFSIAADRAPTVIFFDEIDSLLSTRNSNEHEATRRMKTEFLVQLDGASSNTENVLVLAATNRPFDLDSAALRRLPKRILIGLPDEEVIESMLRNYMKSLDADFEHKDKHITEIASMLIGLSAGDIKAVIQAAAMAPINELEGDRFMTVKKEDLRQVTIEDFKQAFEEFIPSYDAQASYEEYKKWGREVEK